MVVNSHWMVVNLRRTEAKEKGERREERGEASVCECLVWFVVQNNTKKKKIVYVFCLVLVLLLLLEYKYIPSGAYVLVRHGWTIIIRISPRFSPPVTKVSSLRI